jgi:HIV Tat-specific factor 1
MCVGMCVPSTPFTPCSTVGPVLKKMNGRFFDGRRIEATLFSGKQRFKRSGAGDEVEEEGAEAEKKRLDDFAQWLLTEGD